MSDIKLYNEDCMDGMKRYPDKHFELAIVDPPYFKGTGDPNYYNPRLTTSKHKPITKTWDIPNKTYFKELFRVSKNQIIWGCNYYSKYIPHSGRIIWDKKNDNAPFSQAEIASYSIGQKVYIYRYLWNGMLQEQMGKNKEIRIHPTQKPVKLYEWLLKNYAKPGDKILDTHFGSLSIGIACFNMEYDLTAFEIDKDYYETGKERLEKHKRIPRLFTPKEVYAPVKWKGFGLE